MALVKARPEWGTRLPDIDRWFANVFRDPTMFPEVPESPTRWAPSLDFMENANEYVVKLDAAGIPKENLDVNFENGVLTLSGRREQAKTEEDEKFIYREIEQGKFVRSIRVPTPIRGDKVLATYQDGILTVKLAKEKPTAASKIVIK